MADPADSPSPASPRRAAKARARVAKAEGAPSAAAAAPAAPPSTPAVQPALNAKEPAMTNEALKQPVEAVVNAMEAVVPAMEKATADATAHAKAQVETMNARMAEMMEQSMKSVTEMNEFAKGNLDAMIASAKAATAGAETLTSAMVETSKKSFEEAQEAFKALTAAKTPNEALQLHSDFAKAQFEKTVATWSHMSETMLKVSGDVFQPLSSRMAVAAETVKKAMAA